MTKIARPNTLEAEIAQLKRRLHDLESQSPTSTTFKDSAGTIRVAVGALDILGGVYVGKYGWVVFNASGGVVSSQYA